MKAVDGAAFMRQEDPAVLEARLRVERPALKADFRKKQKTVLKKSKAAKGQRARR